MNRRQKIIVSVTGIFIVLLILIGLTYAYFLTRITGNGNPTSISVTTANLELVYGDGTTSILTSETPLMPSTTPIGTKDFTVTNNGDDSEYVVVFEDVTVKYAADTVINGQAVTAGTDTTFESNDFVYTLTCTVKDKSGNTLTDKSCDGVENGSFPIDGGIVLGNSIDKDDVHNYVLTMYYLDNGLDQSSDMNKTLNGKVNIKDIKSINPYSDNTESLAYNIINNSMFNKNGTELKAKPETKVAEEISLSQSTGEYGNVTVRLATYDWLYADTKEEASNGTRVTKCTQDLVGKWLYSVGWMGFDGNGNISTIKVTDCDGNKPMYYGEIKRTESILSVTQDDYGTSYYYRGNVKDNYVNFAGMCWRVVRIEGDGSIKLILEDQYATCNDKEDTDNSGTEDYAYTGNWSLGNGNYGYEEKDVVGDSYPERIMNYLTPVTNAEKSMVKIFYDFQTTKLADYTDKLKSGDWCLGDKAYTRSGTSGSYTYTPLEEYDYSSDMYYDASVRLSGDNKDGYLPTYKCNGTILNNFSNATSGETIITTESPMYVATLTADEIVYAGGSLTAYSDEVNHYLVNNFQINYDTPWALLGLQTNSSGDDTAFMINRNGALINSFVYEDWVIFRPAITLKSGSVITEGNGTQSNPYIVD